VIAARTQFPGAEIEVNLRPHTRTVSEIEEIVIEANKSEAFIVHTLVSDELRSVMLQMGRLHNVETIDLMGSLLERLSQQLSVSPTEKPGLFRQLNGAYFRRIETMEFALNHDDGLRTEELHKAEIILLGVSRTFKTPLSIYLSFKGWFVANVPIVLDIEPPSVLFDLPPTRIFCLTTDARRLAELRRARQELFIGLTGEYADKDFVYHEIKYALRFFNRQPKWPIIDVTGKPIEEIASEIISLVKSSKPT